MKFKITWKEKGSTVKIKTVKADYRTQCASLAIKHQPTKHEWDSFEVE